MHVRPMVVTGAAAAISLAAVATVVLATTPEQASVALIWLLWAAVFVAVWSLLATGLLIIRQSLVRAVWVSIWWAGAVIALLLLLHKGILTKQLLGSILLATLGVSGFVLWALRPSLCNGGTTKK